MKRLWFCLLLTLWLPAQALQINIKDNPVEVGVDGIVVCMIR